MMYFEAAAAAQLERDKLAAEAQEREQIKAHQIRLLELQGPNVIDAALFDVALSSKVPMYRDGDDITPYLIKFERISELQLAREFIIFYQFIISLPTHLPLHIKEHDCHTLANIVKLADNWSLTHLAYPTETKPNQLPLDRRQGSAPNNSAGASRGSIV